MKKKDLTLRGCVDTKRMSLRLKLLKSENSAVVFSVFDNVRVFFALEPSVFPVEPDGSVALDVFCDRLLS